MRKWYYSFFSKRVYSVNELRVVLHWVSKSFLLTAFPWSTFYDSIKVKAVIKNNWSGWTQFLKITEISSVSS